MKIIAPNQFKTSTWKNGLGTTSQISIHPEGADFSLGEFDYRLSMAEVKANGPFSQFPGLERLLVIWQGNGMLLGGRSLPPLTPFAFNGGEQIEGSLVEGPVKDLGLIFQPQKFSAQMHVMRSDQKLLLAPGTHFIFQCKNQALVNGKELKEGECGQLDGMDFMAFESEKWSGLGVLVSLNPKA